MTELYVSDAHIGLLPDGRLTPLFNYIRANPVDRVEFLGDTFHLNEVRLADVLATDDFHTLCRIAVICSVDLLPGNHDWDISQFNSPFFGMGIIQPYVDQWGYYHSHWHEFDPISKLPHWFHKWFGRLFGRKTPYQLLQGTIKNPAYLAACQAIHTRIIYEHKYRGYIGGHTHLPMQWILPDPKVELWNCGDQVDSFTAIENLDGELRSIKLQ